MRAVLFARLALVAGYLGLVAAVIFVEDGRSWFWTVAVASLPLFWVGGGYALWRRICPLAFFSQVPRLLGRPGDRKVTGWVAENALLVQLCGMVVALSARLLWIDGSRAGLAGFLLFVASAALVSGLFLRGRSWCHFICPVGLVETVYTEPSRLIGEGNSQCSPCSGCRSKCPDIDVEHAYWKGSGERSRRIAYFAWPGIVLGFYLYFALQSGTWAWYLSGDWTRESDVVSKLLTPGWFFLGIPRLVAAPLTLILGGIASFGIFELGYGLALRRAGATNNATVARVRHRAFTLAGYIAFNLFYAFAGQPTLLTLPAPLRWAVGTLVVGVSSLMLVRRWQRNESTFLQERLATKLAKHWAWDDDVRERSASELVALHADRTRRQKERLDGYRQSVRELAVEGILSREGLAMLGAVRRTLGITDPEHAAVLKELTAAGATVFGGAGVSPENMLQHQQYRGELGRLVELAAETGTSIDTRALERLRRSHSVSEEEHRALLASLLDPGQALSARLVEEANRLVFLGDASNAADSVAHAGPNDRGFLEYACDWAGRESAESLSRALSVVAGVPGGLAVARTPRERGAAARALLTGPLRSAVPPSRPDPLGDAAVDTDTFVVAGAALVLGRGSDLGHRLAVLRGVALFQGLAPSELERLLAQAQARHFAVGDELCVQGEPGNEVLVILTGRASVRVAGAEVNVCGPGDNIGELAALAPGPRTATVVALEPTEALVLSGEQFRGLLWEQPRLAEGVMEQLARRLRGAESRARG